ncbi:MAG: LytTR family DNA-binding domain-containing protein [Desulfobacteraceae bacterium]|nr:LytTR family DNA-binding domain-containing protein [Desulfobacteraceae bacterium]
MKTVTAIVADDEDLIRAGVVRHLERLWPELAVTGQAKNGMEALDLMEQTAPDIAFLDIRMPGMTGLEVAKKSRGHCSIVFITAYDQYAVQAFESEAVDYILKPVNPDRLAVTVGRLKKLCGSPNPASRQQIQKVIQLIENRDPPDHLNLITVKTGEELQFIPVARVTFFKAEDKYTIVQTASHEYLIKTPIRELAKRLDPDQFRRVHRSAIVNMEKIQAIQRSFTIILKGMDSKIKVPCFVPP